MNLKKLALNDMDAAASVHRSSFDDRLPWLKGLRTPEEDRSFYRKRVFPSCAVWGAHRGRVLVGIIAFRAEWIDQLYVLPAEQGHGIGSELLEVAKAAFPRLQLWTFQRNLQASTFCESRGFVPVRKTNGGANDENEPDVLYAWVLKRPFKKRVLAPAAQKLTGKDSR